MIGVAAEPVTRRQGGARDAGESPRGARPWAAPRNNPRIVRVPCGAGGKDRHSKVATVRGLRDRRVRLSVPTAVQLYDLQDRLGLCQPSKVVDWLLDAARHAIDKLPPLPPLPCHTPHASFPPAGGCDAAGAGRTATGFEHQELELEDAPYCHVMERSSGVSFAAYSHWDPPGGHLLPPEAACSTAPVFAPAFDHSKVHYAYSYLDGAPRGFRASTRD